MQETKKLITLRSRQKNGGIIKGTLAQLVPACRLAGSTEKNAFLKRILLNKSSKMNGTLAQLVEHRTENPGVPGSIPGGTTIN